MALYKIEWKNSATKELRKIDKKFIPSILETVEALSKNPHPNNSKKLLGSEHTFRIRINNYRVVYNIIKSKVLIYIVKVGHRKEIYR